MIDKHAEYERITQMRHALNEHDNKKLYPKSYSQQKERIEAKETYNLCEAIPIITGYYILATCRLIKNIICPVVARRPKQ